MARRGFIAISVVNNGEQLATVQASSTDTVEMLRQVIAKSIAVDPHVSLQLLLGDTYLLGPGSVAQHGISNGATINVLKKRGLVVTGSADNNAMVWDCKSGRNTYILKGHSDVVHSVAFSPNNRLVASGSHDRTIRLWNMETGGCLTTWEAHNDVVVSVSFSADGKLLLTGSYDKTAKVWSIPDSLLAHASTEDTAAESQCVLTLDGHEDSVTSAGFAPNGSYIVTGSLDGVGRLWNMSGKIIGSLRGHEAAIRSVAFSPNSDLVVTGSMDQTAKVWDFQSGKCKLTLSGHGGSVNSVGFSSDGSLILTGSRDFSAKVWDSKNGKCLQTLRGDKGHRESVHAASFSNSGRFIVTGSADTTAKVWTLGSDEATPITLQGHSDAVRFAAFSHGI
jgi:WD40 repeat protein